MTLRALRSPEERVGTLPNTALPPPAEEETPQFLDQLLREALLGGNERALRTVIDRLRPDMLQIAAHHVRSRDDAEDVVQETWIAALGAVHRFEGRASLRTWLLRILTYRAISAGRRASRTTPTSQVSFAAGAFRTGADPRPWLVSESPSPEEELIGRELRAHVDRVLRTLPSQQRRVVTLRDLEGWSVSEVCERLEVSPSNQRVLLHRARRRLREQLSRYPSRTRSAPQAGPRPIPTRSSIAWS